MIRNSYRIHLIALMVVIAATRLAAAEELIWEAVEPDFFNNPDYSGSYGGLTGLDGYFYIWTALSVDPYYGVQRSADGITWDLIGPGTRCDRGIKLSSGKILLYGNLDDVVIGQDDNWKVFDAAPDNPASILGAAEGNGRIVLCGETTVRRQSIPAWWVSTDGGETFSFYFDAGSPASPPLETVYYANGTFVAGGIEGAVWTSEDGVEWLSHNLPVATVNGNEQTLRLLDIVHANGAFYGVGSYASLFRSVDGESWELLMYDDSAGIYNWLETLLVDGENWYAAGPSGDLIWSSDGGETWESYFRLGNMTDLTGGNGRYYAAGQIVPGGGPISPERDLELAFWESFSAREIAYTQGKWLVLQSLSQNYYIGIPESVETGFLDSATTADGIYYEHPWFGWYSMRSGDWAYHYNMGWIYCPSESNSQVWMYASGLDWIYTSEALWPYFYHLGSGDWILYAGGPDWFWNETQQVWMKRDQF